MKKTSEVLYEAADLINQHGWCRGTLKDSRGRFCLLGAVSVAANGRVGMVSSLLYNALQKVVDCAIGTEFNDEMCKTKRDAMAALWIAGDIAAAGER